MVEGYWYLLSATLWAAGIATAVAVIFGGLRWLTIKLGADQLQIAGGLARDSVVAVERMSNIKGVELDGPAKFRFASSMLTTSAKRAGIELDEDEVNLFVYAALAAYEYAVSTQRDI